MRRRLQRCLHPQRSIIHSCATCYHPLHMRSISLVSLGLMMGLIFSAIIASAWAGPSAPPPSGNIAAPINVGAVDQIKNGNIGMNGLAVFGNSLLQANAYLNWGSTSGINGYGIRDNSGTLEFKDSGGPWSSLQDTIST